MLPGKNKNSKSPGNVHEERCTRKITTRGLNSLVTSRRFGLGNNAFRLQARRSGKPSLAGFPFDSEAVTVSTTILAKTVGSAEGILEVARPNHVVGTIKVEFDIIDIVCSKREGSETVSLRSDFVAAGISIRKRVRPMTKGRA